MAKNGEYKTYYKSGKLKKVEHWVNNELHGDIIEYYPSGEVEIIRRMVNGKQEEFTNFYRNGKVWAHALGDQPMTMNIDFASMQS